MKSGHTGVFERSGKKRLPIEEKMGLSAKQMIENEKIIDSLEDETQKLVNERVIHEMNRILNGYGG